MRPASPPNYERAPVHSAESAATTFGDEERRLSQGTALPEQQRVAGRGRVAGYPSPPFLAASVRGGMVTRWPSRSPATATTCPRSRTGAGPRRAPEGARKDRKQVASCRQMLVGDAPA